MFGFQRFDGSTVAAAGATKGPHSDLASKLEDRLKKVKAAAHSTAAPAPAPTPAAPAQQVDDSQQRPATKRKHKNKTDAPQPDTEVKADTGGGDDDLDETVKAIKAKRARKAQEAASAAPTGSSKAAESKADAAENETTGEDAGDEEEEAVVVAAAAAAAATTDSKAEAKLPRLERWKASKTFKAFVGTLLTKHLAGETSVSAAVPVESKSEAEADGGGAAAAAEPKKELSVEEGSAEWGLHAKVVANLHAHGLKNFFPIQSEAVPTILAAERGELPGVGDVCISAPTGSGKTLTYVLPIVQCLMGRTVPQLRALVLVPTRDLVQQVHKVFDKYTADTDLRVVALMGQTSMAAERASLLGSSKHAQLPWESARTMTSVSADIIVATPGRLVDHLEDTPGFSLQHLRFLVIDEADRLLYQSYQNWLPRVYASLYAGKPGAVTVQPQLPFTTTITVGTSRTLVSRGRYFSHDALGHGGTWQPQCRRILCSATLTRNPQKLAQLALNRPVTFSAGLENVEDENADDPTAEKRFKIPPGLAEGVVVCNSEQKPIVLWQLLRAVGQHQAIVFTSSVQATHRLTRLLQLLGGLEQPIWEFSASLPQSKRTKILAQLRAGAVATVICSDAAARGLDVQAVRAVFQYDAPHRVKTYIHRVGRTARAGRAGVTYTLVEPQQAHHFYDMLKKVENSNSQRETVDHGAVQALGDKYHAALESLKKVVMAERKGRMSMFESVEAVLAKAEKLVSAGETLDVPDDAVASDAESSSSDSSSSSSSSDGSSTDEE